MADDERREVARRLREIRPCKSGHIKWWEIARALGLKQPAGWFGWEKFEPDSTNRLADLIEPTDGFDLDTVQRVCFECMEGCDEPEWTLYTTIHDAIARYKRGESGLTCDRDALLALADEMELDGAGALDDGDWCKPLLIEYARRIREALGMESSSTKARGR